MACDATVTWRAAARNRRHIGLLVGEPEVDAGPHPSRVWIRAGCAVAP
jgi:hypothetical protein